MRKTHISRIIFITIIVIFFTSGCTNKNQNQWLQFRGYGALGIAPKNATPPIDFSPNENILWKIETPEGLSSPIIIANNLMLTGVNRDKREYIIWNINLDSGEIKWKKKVSVKKIEQVHSSSSPASATPASDGESIYCYFPSFGLICYDLEGNKVWERPIKYQNIISGSGTSPVIFNNYLILNKDNLIEPRLIVFNKNDGQLLWEYHFSKSKVVSSASWSTPVIWNNQIIIHRDKGLEGIDIESKKQIWHYRIGTMGEATPVIIMDTLFVNAWNVRGEKALQNDIDNFENLFFEIDSDNNGELTGKEFKKLYPKGIPINERTEAKKDLDETTFPLFWRRVRDFDENDDKRITKNEWQGLVKRMEDFSNHGLIAIQLGDTGNVNLSSQLWKVSEDISETPSVLVHNGLVYMVKNGGTTTCVNAHSGEIIYKEKLGATGVYFSSPMFANGYIYYSSYNGKITIVKAGQDFEIINQIDLNEKIGASPVAVGDKLIVRTATHLYAFKE